MGPAKASSIPRQRLCPAKNSQAGLAGRVLDLLKLQIGIAQRRGGKKLREVSNAAGLALPFFSRDDNGCELAITGNGLRTAGSGTVEDLAEFSFGFGYSPLA